MLLGSSFLPLRATLQCTLIAPLNERRPRPSHLVLTLASAPHNACLIDHKIMHDSVPFGATFDSAGVGRRKMQ